MTTDENEFEEDKGRLERIAERVGSISYIQTLKALIQGEKKVAVIVDAPNILRRVNDRQIRLEDIDEQITDIGKIVIKKVILNEHASENLIKAVTNSGYEPIVSSHDLYITLAIEAMSLLNQMKNIDTLVLATRHARAGPILLKIKERGVETVIVGYEPGLSVALKKTADIVKIIDI